MPFVLQQKKRTGSMTMVKNWSECAGSKRDTKEEVEVELEWWKKYDEYYSQSEWEYQIVSVKK